MSVSIVLAGGGKMGAAMLAGWLDRGLDPSDVLVVEPEADTASALAARHGVGVVAAPDDIGADVRPATVVFAVKPQLMNAVAPAYARFAGSDPVFLSIAAGRTIASFEALLGPGAAIVRAMPNTPAAIGRGITVACANGRVTAARRTACTTLLEAVGEVAWVEDEALMDAVTAVSGSGPAYVFLLAECLAEAGVEAGLPADLARRLACATVAGAGELLRRSDDPPEILRRAVTSPGGTTAAALEGLMDPRGLSALMTSAVAAAVRRSRELAG
jgi:pyrroline-5-carboxylate reductase